jgi:hypothetical protein
MLPARDNDQTSKPQLQERKIYKCKQLATIRHDGNKCAVLVNQVTQPSLSRMQP